MKTLSLRSFSLPEFVCWVCLYFSIVSLVYHIRWYVPWLENGFEFLVPAGQKPGVWFLSQILTNVLLVSATVFLTLFVRSFRKTEYFNTKSGRYISGIIWCCIGLGAIGLLKTVMNNPELIHWEDWNSPAAILNLLMKSVTELVFLREPQTMYFLLGMALWIIRLFITKAVGFKEDSEAVI